MLNAFVVEILTPKKIRLNGLWMGPAKPKRAYIIIHGLMSSAFSRLDLAEELVDKNTAVMTFNNRGHDAVASVTQIIGRKKKRILAGCAHEVFTECVDDVQGAVNFARREGAKEIIIVGHSTGCQKAVYWAHKTKGRGVKGLILLAPVSDYAGAIKKHGKAKIERLVNIARSMIRDGRPNELIPKEFWSEEPNDARRFVSLYTPESIEQSIFPYFDESRSPKMLRNIRIPMLTIFAGADEYADRPSRSLEAWFAGANGLITTASITGATHSFTKKSSNLGRLITKWNSNI
jgi:pimeloyl-ACP methyl ester carboxylesterase